MRQTGRLSSASEDDLPEPMDPEELEIMPSEVLRELRSNER